MTQPLTLQAMFGLVEDGGPEWANAYELEKDDFDWVVDELDLVVEEEDGVRYTYDPDDDHLVGEFDESELVFYTDLNLDEFLEDEELEESNLKRDGTLDFRKLLGKATKQYQQALVAGATYASPVVGDASDPAQPGPAEVVTERIVKRVNSKGKISRTLDRRTRRRKATQTTGMSPAKRKQIARKAARTKKRNPMIGKRALRKRKKALRKRKSLGLR